MSIKNKRQLGKILKEIREKKKISKRAIYKEKTIYQLQVQAIEKGSSNYTIDTLFEYLDKIGCSMEIKYMQKDNLKKETDNGTKSGAYDWEKEQEKNFCRNRECPFYDGWNYGCKQRSDAQKCAARHFY